MRLYDIWDAAWSQPGIEEWERPAYSTWVYKRWTAFLAAIGEVRVRQGRSLGVDIQTESEWRSQMMVKHRDAFLAWVQLHPGTGPM